jgi:hypothetical protein
LIYSSSSIHYKNIPRHDIYEVESILKHGDVIFINNYYVHNLPVYLTKTVINFRNNHSAIIIEEDHKKYVIESNKDFLFTNHIQISHQSYFAKWNIFKIPLLEYLNTYPFTLIRFFRNETNSFTIKNDITFEPILNKFYYCNVLTGDLLKQNGLIPSSTKLFRYRARELIELLQQNGYKGYELICK